ncbi:MAG: TIGR02281 family clan AA aspartic protease [Gammaproteobacteria bacterium]|nr:MAG: TIGR02281 family clan AA aspartic protease [Gammaproteobacteria bacterium]
MTTRGKIQTGIMAVVFLMLAVPVKSYAVDKIALYALFKDKVIILVDGNRRVISTGQSTREGIKLVSTNTANEEAVVQVGDKRVTLRLGVVMHGGGMDGKKTKVTLYADASGHFRAEGAINDQPISFLVDTGATRVALNSRMAKRLGIDYKTLGSRGYANTASGVVRVYNITLDKVSIGGITLRYVDAAVIEGNFPTQSLLGMSFLGKLNMRRDGQRMELITQ